MQPSHYRVHLNNNRIRRLEKALVSLNERQITLKYLFDVAAKTDAPSEKLKTMFAEMRGIRTRICLLIITVRERKSRYGRF